MEISAQKLCRTSGHSSTKPGFTAMYKLGFRNCVHLPTWHYVSGNHTCRKWEAK
jgi:hypothetical protein